MRATAADILVVPDPPPSLGAPKFPIRSFVSTAAHHQWASWLRGVLSAAKRARIRRGARLAV